MGVAKSDFCQMRRSDLGLTKNTEHFAQIDLDLSRFEKNAPNVCGSHLAEKWFQLILHRTNGLTDYLANRRTDCS